MKIQVFHILACAGGVLAMADSALAAITEDFSSNPLAKGWEAWGQTQLFEWTDPAGVLSVTWDSSRPNSYFALPLRTVLTRSNDFSLSLDLHLASFVAGWAPGRASTFQIAFGFVRKDRATGPDFLRGTGFSSPDLVEFSFFPDPGGDWLYGPSVTGTMIDSSGVNWSSGGFGAFGLESNKVYRVAMVFSANDQTLTTTVTEGGQPAGVVSAAVLKDAFLDFRLDHFAVCSYSDAGQFPDYAGSVLATGWVDNLQISLPEPPIQSIVGLTHSAVGAIVEVDSQTGWFYTLERSVDLGLWAAASEEKAGNGERLSLADTNQPAQRMFYRVRARLK